MKALLCKAFGPASSLVLEDLPSPEPKKNEVLIEVHAAGVNFPDTLIIEGKYQFKPPFPFAPGGEAAGVVKAVGEKITHLRAGDRVMAENYLQVKTRTQAALHTIVENAQARGDKNVLAISSGTAMQIMISDLTDDNAKNKPLANAAVVKIVYKDGKYTVPEIGTMKYVEAGKQALDKK